MDEEIDGRSPAGRGIKQAICARGSFYFDDALDEKIDGRSPAGRGIKQAIYARGSFYFDDALDEEVDGRSPAGRGIKQAICARGIACLRSFGRAQDKTNINATGMFVLCPG